MTDRSNSINEQYRIRAGLKGKTHIDGDFDDSPAEGELPTTGGETQPPGTERLEGTNASDLESPPKTDGVEADVDGMGDQSGRTPDGEFDAVAEAEAKGVTEPEAKPAKKTTAKKTAAKK